MAFSVVNQSRNNTNTLTSSISITIPAAASGNTLIVFVNYHNASFARSVSSVSCTNTSFSSLGSTSGAGLNSGTDIWFGPVSGGSSGTTVTVNFSGTAIAEACVVECSGIVTSSAADGSATDNHQASGTTPYSTGTYTNTNANDVILLALGCVGTSTTTPSTPSGYTALNSQSDTADNGCIFPFYQVVSSTGSQSASFTSIGGATGVNSVLGGLKLVANTTTTKTQSAVSRIQVTTPRTQSGVSRIQVTTPKTQAGVSRVQITTPRMQSGVSRLQVTTPRTQSGKARLQVTTSRTQSGVTRIQNTSSHTESGMSRIQVTASQKTLIGASRVQVTSTQTEAGVSRIQATTTHALSGTSRLQVTTGQSSVSQARLQTTKQQNIAGLAAIITTSSVVKNIAGVSRIRVTVRQAQTAGARIQSTRSHVQLCTSRVQSTIQRTLVGVSNVVVQGTTQQDQRAISRIQSTVVQPQHGTALIAITTVQHQVAAAKLVSGRVGQDTHYDLYVPAENRIMFVPVHKRMMMISVDGRTMAVPASPRVMTVSLD